MRPPLGVARFKESDCRPDSPHPEVKTKKKVPKSLNFGQKSSKMAKNRGFGGVFTPKIVNLRLKIRFFSKKHGKSG